MNHRQPVTAARRRARRRRGAAMIEYCLLLSLLAMVGIAGTQKLSALAGEVFNQASSAAGGRGRVTVESDNASAGSVQEHQSAR